MHLKAIPSQFPSATDDKDDDAIIVEIARLAGWFAALATALGAGVIVLIVLALGT